MQYDGYDDLGLQMGRVVTALLLFGKETLRFGGCRLLDRISIRILSQSKTTIKYRLLTSEDGNLEAAFKNELMLSLILRRVE